MTLEAYKKMRIEYTRLFNKLKSENIKQKDFKEQANINYCTMKM